MKALDNPLIYRWSQLFIAPGAGSSITHHIKELITELPHAGVILDVGCGPVSWLFQLGLRPIGVDLSVPYLRTYNRKGTAGVVALAEELPFAEESFDGIWSINMFHHLPDTMASAAIREFLRVCKSPGYVVIFDGIMPDSKWRHPVATGIRCFDRGKFMRSQEELEALIPDPADWSVKRFSSGLSGLGLEYLICWHVRK